MGRKPTPLQNDSLFLAGLDGQINMRHLLLRLAELIDWTENKRGYAAAIKSEEGQAALPPRLISGLP